MGQKYGEALYAGERYENTKESSWYESMYSLKNPYDAGKLTEDTHRAMTAMTNFYRWLAWNRYRFLLPIQSSCRQKR